MRTLTLTCPDRPGIVAAVSGWLTANGANIVDASQHREQTDGGPLFAMRVECEGLSAEAVARFDQELARAFTMRVQWLDARRPARVAVCFSGEDHCAVDIAWRLQRGELAGTLAGLIASDEAAASAFPLARATVTTVAHPPGEAGRLPGAEGEAVLLEQLRALSPDVVVLARYMRILSPQFLESLSLPLINIHHSTLPAFAGARPYERAFARGVKLIGATAHYVTTELDDGPIIAQQAAPVTHSDSVADLRRKGADMERLVLEQAVRAHLEGRVVVMGRRAIVL